MSKPINKLFSKFLTSNSFDYKNNSFDFIRLLMAILVVVGHSGGVGGFGWEPHLRMRDWGMELTNMATFSVYGFFVISGFLITRSWLGSKSVQDFCIKRIKRIYPGYFVSLLITSFIFIPLYYFLQFGFLPFKFLDEYGKDVSNYFIKNLGVESRITYIKSLTLDIPDKYFDINGPYWTLIHEIRAYGLILILGILGFLNNKKIILTLAAMFNFVYVLCSFNVILPIGSKTLHFRDIICDYIADYHIFIIFTYFVFGMVFYIFQDKVIWNNWFYVLSILGLVIGWKLDIFPVFAPLCFTYFVLYSSQVFPLRNLAKKIGDLSYGIYIYSWPIQLCLLYLGLNKVTSNKFLDYPIYALISVILSAVAGYLSWNFVEKRWLTRKP
jgi:peptidoglycan/LPS O-acetylase OafA/YrhL